MPVKFRNNRLRRLDLIEGSTGMHGKLNSSLGFLMLDLEFLELAH